MGEWFRWSRVLVVFSSRGVSKDTGKHIISFFQYNFELRGLEEAALKMTISAPWNYTVLKATCLQNRAWSNICLLHLECSSILQKSSRKDLWNCWFWVSEHSVEKLFAQSPKSCVLKHKPLLWKTEYELNSLYLMYNTYCKDSTKACLCFAPRITTHGETIPMASPLWIPVLNCSPAWRDKAIVRIKHRWTGRLNHH